MRIFDTSIRRVLKKRQKNCKTFLYQHRATCQLGLAPAPQRRDLFGMKRWAVSRTYEIGPFHLDPALGALTQAGVPQALGARAVAVLAALVEHANEYVPKSAIIDAAWPGLIVSESNLAVQVSAIRARARAGRRRRALVGDALSARLSICRTGRRERRSSRGR